MIVTHDSYGFTLVELLVSIIILLTLSGLLIAGYNGFNNTQAAKQGAASLKINLESARSKAAYGLKPDGCSSLEGYLVQFPTNTTYTVVAFCTVSGVAEPVGDVTTFVLPPGLIFSPIPQQFMFLPLNQGVSLSQQLTIVGNNATQTVFVLMSGVITDFVPTPTP